jgi:hypothetical protein
METQEAQNIIAQAEQQAIINQINDPFNLGIKPEEKKEEKNEPENKDVVALPLMNLDVKDNPFQKLNEATGFEFKSETEVVDTLKKLKGFEDREKDYLDKISKGNEYMSFIDMMPEKLKAPIMAYAEERDWESVVKQVFGVGEIDFNKSWGDYDDHVPLIQKYNPDLSQEDWDALDEKGKNAFIMASKNAYNKERTDWQSTIKTNTEVIRGKLDKRADAIKNSIEESIAELKKNYPNLTEQQVTEVRTTMYRSPLNNIVQKDGTFTKEAATKLAFANYGPQTLTQAIEEVEKKWKAEIEKTRKEVGGKKLEVQVQAANDKVPASDTRKTDNAQDKIKQQIKNISSNPGQMFVNKNSH